MNVLRMLKGSNWGMAKDPLLNLYRALIRPVIEYGMEIYFNSSDSLLKQVERIQSECLRICSGALRSTPLNCLQHYCNEMPLKIKFEQLCLYHRAHLSTFADHPTFSAICDCWRERYPDGSNFCSFNMRTKGLYSNPKLEIKKASIPDIPISLFKNPTINLDLLYN